MLPQKFRLMVVNFLTIKTTHCVAHIIENTDTHMMLVCKPTGNRKLSPRCKWKGLTYTGMHHIMTFQSMMDRTHDSGPIRL